MKTAVEFLLDEINKLTGLTIQMNEPCVEQAAEMEKKQISKAYKEGWNCPHGEGFPETGEQYYNETFTNSSELPTSSKQEEQ